MNQNIGVPIAIVVAGILVAGSIFYVNKDDLANRKTGNKEAKIFSINSKAISIEDHILGNPDANIILVEYSDTECPYCKNYHVTMKQVMDEYGKDGKVSWVYRHFPIKSLHPSAPMQAEVTECVAKEKGEDVFWKFLASVYEAPRAVGTQLSDTALYALVAKAGANSISVKKCVSDKTFTEKITASYNEALEAGASGTPYSILFLKKELSSEQLLALKDLNDQLSGGDIAYTVLKADEQSKNKVAIYGALPYNLMKTILDIVLN